MKQLDFTFDEKNWSYFFFIYLFFVVVVVVVRSSSTTEKNVISLYVHRRRQ